MYIFCLEQQSKFIDRINNYTDLKESITKSRIGESDKFFEGIGCRISPACYIFK